MDRRARTNHRHGRKALAASSTALAAIGLLLAAGCGPSRAPTGAAAAPPTAPADDRCGRGDGAACAELGARLERAGDLTAAVAAQRRGCEANVPFACDAILRFGMAGQGGLTVEDVAPYVHALCEVKRIDAACHPLAVLTEKYSGSELHFLTGRPRSNAGAPSLHQRACAVGATPACVRLAELYLEGRLVERDLARATALYQTSCDGGSQLACTRLASLSSEPPDPPDLERCLDGGAAACERACDAKVARACTERGFLTEGTAYPTPWYARGCDLGDPLGCVAIAFLWHDGEGGLKRDEARAVAVFDRYCAAYQAGGLTARSDAALAGMESCELLQSRYWGEVARERLPAAEQVRRHQGACTAERRFLGCGPLGDLLFEGSGAAKDVVRGAALYRQACDGGVVSYCVRLGLGITGGHLQSGDAVTPLTRACDAGDARSCTALSGLLRAAEPGRADALRERACDLGDDRACP